MKNIYLILCFLISLNSFSQSKESNGTIFKNGPCVEIVRNLMNTYSTNNINKIKKVFNWKPIKGIDSIIDEIYQGKVS